MRRVDSRGPREEQKKDSREKLRRDVEESGHTCPRGIFLSPLVVVRMEGKKKKSTTRRGWARSKKYVGVYVDARTTRGIGLRVSSDFCLVLHVVVEENLSRSKRKKKIFFFCC